MQYTDKWWEPQTGKGFYWPPGVPFDISVDSYATAYESVGYERCTDSSLEPGIEKIALFEDDDRDFCHAARQLESGKWTSKLGPNEDIEHDTARGAEGGGYGKLSLFMKRPRK